MKTSIIATFALGLLLTSIASKAQTTLIGGFENTWFAEQGGYISNNTWGTSGFDSTTSTQGSTSAQFTATGATYNVLAAVPLFSGSYNYATQSNLTNGVEYFASGASVVVTVDVLWTGGNMSSANDGNGGTSPIQLTFESPTTTGGSWYGSGVDPTSGTVVNGVWSTLTWTLDPVSFARLATAEADAANANGYSNLEFVAGSSGAATINIDKITFSTVSAIPEPGTYAALAGLLAFGIVVIRRRIRR